MARGRPRARSRRAEELRRLRGRRPLRRRPLRCGPAGGARADRGRPAGAVAHGRRERRRRSTSRQAGRVNARPDRNRVASRVAARAACAPPCRSSSASSPTRETRSASRALCERFDCEPGEYNRDAAEQDVVVTATSSKDPVLRGEWLKPGALVCAMGANRIESRELDNAVLERAAFVCCDSKEQARIEAGDLVEPVERGVLDWLEVHELAEVVSGEIARPRSGRRHRPLQEPRHRGRGSGRRQARLRPARASAASASSSSALAERAPRPWRRVSSPTARMTSGRSSRRRRCSSVARFFK